MAARNYGLVKNLEQLQAFVDRLVTAGQPIGIDIETGFLGEPRDGISLHPDDPASMIVGISFTNSTEWARYVPLAHDLTVNFEAEPTAELFWQLVRTGLCIAQNGKFELRHMSRWFRETLPDDHECQATRGYFPFLSDTMIESYILAEQPKHGLKALTKSVFNHDQADLLSLFPGMAKNKSKALRFNILELTPEVVSYACEESVWCLALHLRNYPQVKDNFLFKVELLIVPILCAMEDFGVKFDWPEMQRKAIEGRGFLDLMNEEIQADLSAMVGTQISINLGSPPQIADVLYTKLGMPVTRKTKGTGNPSTDAIALAALAKQYPVVKKILEWKEMRVLLTRYLEKYEKDYGYAPDGMAHPNYMQTAVATGRFAVNDPPVQQVPKAYHYALNSGKTFELNFRDLLICPPHHYWLGYDYSQIELRMMAGESGEPTLIHAFENDEDVHTATASSMLGVPKDQVTKDQRAVGKMLNFALLYGMGPKSLSERLAISKEEGQALYDQYFSSYSSISVWVNRQEINGRKNGYTMSKFGRKFVIWEYKSDDAWIVSKGDRLCVNAPIQGAAADFMKIAMTRQHKVLENAGLLDRVHLVMNIHDALEYYVHESVNAEDVVRLLAPAVTFRVPGLPKIVADWHTGLKWGSLTELRWDGEHLIRKDGSDDEEEESEVLDLEGGGDAEWQPSVTAETIRAVTRSKPNSAVDFSQKVEREKYAPDNRQAVLDHTDAARAVSSFPASQTTAVYFPDGSTALWAGEQQQSEPQAVSEVSEAGKTVEVTITEMPIPDHYQRWIEFMNSSVGNNMVILHTPEGDLEYETPCGVTLTDMPKISMLLGAVKEVKYSADSVDTSSIMKGISL